MSNENSNNPFVTLSNLFIENQRQFNVKSSELIKRIDALTGKLKKLSSQIENDVFSADLISILHIEEESTLILGVAKELEFQRDQIINSVEVLTKSKKVKLNK